MAKNFTIPTVLKELRRVVLETAGFDIMVVDNNYPVGYTVSQMVDDLTAAHMRVDMEMPGQTTLSVAPDLDQTAD